MARDRLVIDFVAILDDAAAVPVVAVAVVDRLLLIVASVSVAVGYGSRY